MADIEERIKGINEANVKSKLNISTANIMAANGALKIDDIAAAAAAPINNVREVWFKWNSLEMLEPIAALVATVGPSNPTDPPKPTVNGAVKIELNILETSIIPFLFEIAKRVAGIPWETGFFNTYFIIISVSSNPIIGKIK